MSRPVLLDLFSGAGGAAIEARFWAFVAKGDDSDCWEWTGSRKDTGYGQLNVARRPERAHRISFLIHNGYLPKTVLHSCDNPPCVNPAHLTGGTQADNMADAAKKGRVRGGVCPGSANHQAKLTENSVREARSLAESGMSLRALARRYSVDRKTITQAVRRERWQHV